MSTVSDERNMGKGEDLSAGGEGGGVRLIIFRLQREWLALRAEEIREVVQQMRVTRVPNSPTAVVGIMNLRGRILLVFDLDLLLGLPQRREKDTLQLVILNLADQEIDLGFLVDQVAQIREIPVDRMKDLSTSDLGERKGAFFRGALYHEGLLVHVLDPAPIISSLMPELEEAVE